MIDGFIFFAALNNIDTPPKAVRNLIKERYIAKKHNDRSLLKSIQKNIKALISNAKKVYKDKMLNQMSSNIRNAWRGIKAMSHLNSKPPDITTSNDRNSIPKLAQDLNEFYLRFERKDKDCSIQETEIPDTGWFTMQEVTAALKCGVPGKASGPDKIPATIIKSCAAELSAVMCDIFNRCLDTGYIPKLWRSAEVVPVPKKRQPMVLNDYRPIALTSILMKCFEHIIESRLTKYLSLDESQFAYKSNRSTTDACLSLDHVLRSHLDKPKCYARVLFVIFHQPLTLYPLPF